MKTPHYICTGGCEGVSEKPGVCRTEGCEKEVEPLTPCDCTDGTHHGAFDVLPEAEEE